MSLLTWRDREALVAAISDQLPEGSAERIWPRTPEGHIIIEAHNDSAVTCRCGQVNSMNFEVGRFDDVITTCSRCRQAI